MLYFFNCSVKAMILISFIELVSLSVIFPVERGRHCFFGQKIKLQITKNNPEFSGPIRKTRFRGIGTKQHLEVRCRAIGIDLLNFEHYLLFLVYRGWAFK